jgi:uncharacterized LabA/DUF88 family protein
MPTAVVIDGAYFLRRFKSSFPDLDSKSAKEISVGVLLLARFHIRHRLMASPILQAIDGGGAEQTLDRSPFGLEETSELYRIFFYDCPPLTKRLHRPVSHRSLSLAQTPEAQLRLALHKELQSIRKVALRLGRLNDKFSEWRPTSEAISRWLKNPSAFEPKDEDFTISVTQKGVDMKLGLDVASIAFRRQCDQIIIVAGDADFVPAVKLARREGIDVVLDPMWGNPAPDLREHVDGERSCLVPGNPFTEMSE